jgi:phosphate transport system permease protein
MNVSNLKRQKFSPRTLFGLIMTGIAGACIIITLIPLFAVLTYVAVQGLSHINLNLFTKLPPPPGLAGGGIANAILGTLIVVFRSLVIIIRWLVGYVLRPIF